MKIYSLGRCMGKTMRLLYISEYTGAPIVCATNISKQSIEQQASRFGIHIPTPIVLNDTRQLFNTTDNGYYLVDNAEYLLQLLIYQHTNGRLKHPLALTITEDK